MREKQRYEEIRVRRPWKALKGFGRPLKALEGIARPEKALEGLGRPWNALEDLGRHWKALVGLGRLGLERHYKAIQGLRPCKSLHERALEGPSKGLRRLFKGPYKAL